MGRRIRAAHQSNLFSHWRATASVYCSALLDEPSKVQEGILWRMRRMELTSRAQGGEVRDRQEQGGAAAAKRAPSSAPPCRMSPTSSSRAQTTSNEVTTSYIAMLYNLVRLRDQCRRI